MSTRGKQRHRLQTFLLWFNGTQVLVWGLLIAPTVLLWSRSLLWIALMSVWANFAGRHRGIHCSVARRPDRR